MKGFLFALLTGISWGTVSPVAKELSLLGVDMITVVFLRAAMVSVVLGVWLIFSGGISKMAVTQRQFFLFSVSGLLTVVFTGGGFLLSLEYLSVPVALILHYAFPLVTMIGSLFILKEKPTWTHFLSGGLVVVGLWVGMGGGAAGVEKLSWIGILCGAVSIIGIAGQSILTRYLARPGEAQVDRTVFLFYCFLTGAIFMGSIKFFAVGMNDIPQIFTSGIIFLFVILQAIFGNLFPYWAYFTSLRYISANTASLICTSEIVVAMAIAAVWFGTIPTVAEMFGVVLIISAIAISARCSSRSEKGKSEQLPHEA